MRILGIRFKNINSLAGEWQIDFTQPEFTGDGIFAITGPTGAGKTTVLDVICLALYGRTPRLERVNKSANDVMTRQTGECFAEVTFSTPTGKFRCHWSQHKARRKAEGDLQTPKHEISDANSGQIIDNQIRTVALRIEQTTGMNFQRFTQSMMLAQGGFEAFLKASADERAPILEQITGTGIYSDISIKVHERHAFERNQLQLLQAQLSGLQLLTPEQETALKAEETLKASELAQQQSILVTQRQQRDWKQQCLQLELKVSQLSTQREHWQQQNQAFSLQRGQLDKANRALALAGQYSVLTTLRQHQQDDQQRLSHVVEAEPALQHSVSAQQKNTEQATVSRQQADNKLTEMRPVFKQVHVLDSQISQQRNQLQQAHTDHSTLLVEQNRTQQQTTAMHHAAEQRKQSLQQFLHAGEVSYDPMLQRLADECEQKQQTLSSKKSDINNLTQGKSQSQWRQRSEQLSQSLTQCDVLEQRYKERDALQDKIKSRQQDVHKISAVIKILTEEQQQCQSLLSAREAALAALQQQHFLQQRINNMTSQRAYLVDGQPCALCGSVDHPFANHAPDADAEALNNTIRDAEQLLAQNREQQQLVNHKTLQQQERLRHIKSQQQDEQTVLAVLEGKIALQLTEANIAADMSLGQHRAELRRELTDINQTLDLIEHEQQQLRILDQAAQQAREKLSEVNLSIGALAHAQELLHTTQQQLDKLLLQAGAAYEKLNKQQQVLDALSAERKRLLGEQNPDDLETQLSSALALADRTLQSALLQQQQAEKKLHENRRQRESLTQQINERNEKIHISQATFNDLLNSKDFSSEQDYQAAALPDAERLQLQQQLDQLQQQGTELNALIKQSNAELQNLLQQALSTESLEILQQTLNEQDNKVSQLQETLGGIRRDLNNNVQVREKQQYQAEKIDAQKRELERWAALHELIGSADGKKFRNFAQGLTFELMISHANQQLKKMTDRYALLRDKEQPLDFNVVDFYQAGEVRSTKNLSGGESFTVSLALALGLSRMASRNVRVDSLFLDEGFGTLDEDALDTALETLASLQQEGKLIGVISHVTALKQRISTQIKVIPGPGGRSRISGPGCQLLS